MGNLNKFLVTILTEEVALSVNIEFLKKKLLGLIA